MKKSLLSIFLFMALLATISLNAQTATPAKRYVLFEHYTNASCSPCASQNPFFETFYQAHKVDARHITFHTIWPGTDPMNAANQSEVADMVTYHGVTGVPAMFANGADIGGPANANADMLSNNNSPIRIDVTEEIVEDTVNVTIVVESVQEVPAGDYILRVGAIEETIEYTSAPGNNGEKKFPDVFRKWVANDVVYTPAAVGESVTFEYNYPVESGWNADELYTLAYVVNTANKEVMNTGTAKDINVEAINTSASVQTADLLEGNVFNAKINNISDEPKLVKVILVKDHPEDWNTSFSIDGTSYSDSVELTVNPGVLDLELMVTSGATNAVGRYSLEILLSVTGEKQVQKYIVIKGITDMVSNSAGSTVDILTPYTNGLAFAENNSYGNLSTGELNKAFDFGALTEVQNLYLSVGWVFPAFSDKLISSLSDFLDNGGNLLVAGQDIGWDVMSNHAASNGTPAQKEFYTNYLQTNFVSDGSPSSNAFTAVATDAVFGEASGSSIQNVYGGSNLYPDHITPATDFAHQILKYTNDNGGAAVRIEKDDYKIVYLGFGLEHVGEAVVSNQLMKITHDWFHSTVGTDDFDKFFDNLSLSQNQPNPADNFTEIRINGDLEQTSAITITDISGKIIFSKKVTASDKTIKINTVSMNSGIYFYRLINEDGQSIAKKMIVSH